MTLQEMDAPALEERRDEAPGAGASHARPTLGFPGIFQAEEAQVHRRSIRLRILEEERAARSPLWRGGRLLRREGLYSSHLTEWRISRREGSLQGLTPSKAGTECPSERNLLRRRCTSSRR